MFGAERFLCSSSSLKPDFLHQRIGSAISPCSPSCSPVQRTRPASAPCGRRRPNQCHPLIPRVALPPVRLQRPPVPIVILQLHVINVVAVVVLPRNHRGTRRAHHHRPRPATHTNNIPHHAAACHVRVGEPDSMGHQVRGDASVEASAK
ncbi:regulator of sigma E protease [Trypanosoma cruzi]|nr:regulator of sigma E protease [Trypanosoma cruzi]